MGKTSVNLCSVHWTGIHVLRDIQKLPELERTTKLLPLLPCSYHLLFSFPSFSYFLKNSLYSYSHFFTSKFRVSQTLTSIPLGQNFPPPIPTLIQFPWSNWCSNPLIPGFRVPFAHCTETILSNLTNLLLVKLGLTVSFLDRIQMKFLWQMRSYPLPLKNDHLLLSRSSTPLGCPHTF